MQFILTVDITRSCDKMQYEQILWSQKTRKYLKNIQIHLSLCLDCVAEFAARAQSLTITYSHLVSVYIDHCLILTKKYFLTRRQPRWSSSQC